MNPRTIGNQEMAAWQVAPGIVWIQTRSPQFARKLAARADAQIVARGVAGGYLRTFQFRHGPAWAQRLLARYHTKIGMVTNARKTLPARPVGASERGATKI